METFCSGSNKEIMNLWRVATCVDKSRSDIQHMCPEWENHHLWNEGGINASMEYYPFRGVFKGAPGINNEASATLRGKMSVALCRTFAPLKKSSTNSAWPVSLVLKHNGWYIRTYRWRTFPSESTFRPQHHMLVLFTAWSFFQRIWITTHAFSSVFS